MLGILTNPDLDDRDVRLLALLYELQKTESAIPYSTLAKGLRISTRTVSRRFSNLRELGVVSSVRIGPHEWTHTVLGLSDSATVVREETVLSPEDPEEIVCRPSGTTTLIYPGIISYSSLENNKKDSNYTEGTRVNNIQGPDDKILSLIQASQKKTAVARDERFEKRRKRLAEEPDDGPYVLPATQKRFAHEEKDPMAYTATDLEYVFKDCWRKAGFDGRPFGWTLVEKARMKSLITDQSAQIALEYVQYVFENWDTIQKRFKINGYPSVAVIHGFRRTWVAEMQNGVRDSGRKDISEVLCEYQDTDAGTIGWGDMDAATEKLRADPNNNIIMENRNTVAECKTI